MLEIAVLSLVAQLMNPLNEETDSKQYRAGIIAHAITSSVDRATCYGYDYTCDAIWGVGRVKLAAMLIAKAYKETRFDRSVHSGECGPHRCGAYRDRNGELRFRSVTLWQLEKPPTMTRAEFEGLVGIGEVETSRAAWMATRLLASGWYACKRHEAGAFSYYATGGRCDWSEGVERAKVSRNFESLLWMNLTRIKNEIVKS